MTKAFTFDPRALEDFDEIWVYIAEHASVDTADMVEARFRKACEQVAANPGIGHRRPDYSDRPLRF